LGVKGRKCQKIARAAARSALLTRNYLVSSDNSKQKGWVGHVARKGDKKDAYRVFVGEVKVNRLLEDLKYHAH
jgi:hypothetical protein